MDNNRSMSIEPMLDYVLRQLRETPLRQFDIARESGVPYSTLTKIIQGVIKNPGITHIQCLHDFFRNEDRCNRIMADPRAQELAPECCNKKVGAGETAQAGHEANVLAAMKPAKNIDLNRLTKKAA
jgi:transcriptional regulator with XRE-family HTH domain